VKRVASFYVQVGKTYVKWAPSLILLAAIVFVPIGLIHAVTVHADIGTLDFGSIAKLSAAGLALLALTATGLVGEVFYSGAVAISLTHPHDGRPPSLRKIAGMVSYPRLVAVDLIYGLIVAIGVLLLIVPGAAVFVWLGLAAPIVEIERRSVRQSFIRSVKLVRGNFWVVLAVLGPIEIVGDALGGLATALAHDLLGESLFAEWLADVLANVAFTPFYAVAAVLLTVYLIHAKDGGGPALHSEPTGT
jgi:Uncharacterised protein family (UPF0259)